MQASSSMELAASGAEAPSSPPAALAILEALGAAPLGFVIFDPSLRIVHVNAWLAEADGMPVEAHLGRTLAELFPGLREEVAAIEARLRAVLETGAPTTFSIVRADPGAPRREWVATYSPILSPSREVEGTCGVIFEVTADREREAAVGRSRLEAERAARRLAHLQELTTALAAATEPAGVAEAIVRRAGSLVGAASATVRVLRDGALHLLAASGDFELRPRPSWIAADADAPVARATRRGEALWLEDRATIERHFPGLAGDRAGDAAVAALPLRAGQRTLGALTLAFDRARPFDLEERALILRFADACAPALERALLHEAESAAREAALRASLRLARFQGVTAALSAAGTVEDVAAVVVNAARGSLGAQVAVAYVLEGDAGLSLAAAIGAPELDGLARLPPDAPTPAAHAARTGAASWFETQEALTAAFPRFAEVYPGASRIHALAALPLRARGAVLGAVAFAFEEARRFEPEARELVESVTDQCAVALDRARLLDAERDARADAQRAASRLERLLEITSALSACRTLDDIARTVTELVHAVVGAAVSAAYVLEDGALRLLRVHGVADEVARRHARNPIDAPFPTCRAAATGEPVWLASPEEVAAAFPALSAMGFPLRAVVALPLRAGDRVIGAFGFTFDAPRRLDEAERTFFLSVGEQCAVALDRSRLLDEERRARQDADRARSLLDGILETAPIGIGFFDPVLRCQRVNPKLAEMAGIPIDEHLGCTPRELFPGFPNDAVEQAFHHVVATGEPVLDLELVGEVAPGAGRRVWEESWYPVRSGGSLVGIGAVVREVTKEREAEEFQRHVVGVVGHDLRNPLSAIVTAVKLLERGERDAGRARLLERVARSAGRIDEIVRTLLDFANVRAGRGVPTRRRGCDLAEIARAVADECALAHPGRDVVATGTGDCTGEWDPARVAQLLANLVANALQYSPASAPVRLRWEGRRDEVILEVANEGRPIPAELLPHIFQPFRRGDPEHHGGLGLGLFIARAIAAAHGGRIDARSSADEGTVVSVRLPRG